MHLFYLSCKIFDINFFLGKEVKCFVYSYPQKQDIRKYSALAGVT